MLAKMLANSSVSPFERRKNLYSRVYHKTLEELVANGVGAKEAKGRAAMKARDTCDKELSLRLCFHFCCCAACGASCFSNIGICIVMDTASCVVKTISERLRSRTMFA